MKRNFFQKARRLLNQLEVLAETFSLPRVETKTPDVAASEEPEQRLAGQTIFISGGSRGIGFAIARRCAQAGATVVIAAKTTAPHPKLPGTIYSAADEINQLGAGRAIPVVLDIRDEDAIEQAVAQVVKQTGGIDGVINNASAIHLADMENTSSKRFDLMFSINVRGTFLLTQACLPHLKRSANPHIVTLSPPISLQSKWFAAHGAYTTSKYAMSMMAMTFAEELAAYDIASNALWPKSTIATSAIENMVGGKLLEDRSRKPEIMADACYAIITRDAKTCSGNFFIDEDVLRAQGITDFDHYACKPGHPLQRDLFLEA